MSQDLFDDEFEEKKAEEPVHAVDHQPETADETARSSGLAWSAGIVFFSSIVFMLFLGWGADLLLGTKPWGLVGGIVLGSVAYFLDRYGYDVLPLAMKMLRNEQIAFRTATRHVLITGRNVFQIYPPFDMN